MATQIQVITDANIQYGLAYDETTKQLKIDTDKVVDYAAFDPIKKDIIDSIDGEIQRATDAETVITDNLNAEIGRANDAENVITTNLDAEIHRATAKENEINQALSDEVSRATKAESDLDSKIDAEIERANNQESALDGKITAEANRATAAEGNLNATLMQEIARSGQTDQTLNENLTAEIQRATGAENTITGNLDAEIERATAKENEIINQTIPSCLKDAKDYCDDKLESVNQSINGLSQNLTNHTTESQQQFQAINTSITELGNTKLDKSNPHITGDITVDGVVKLFGDSDTADLSTNEGIVLAIKMILQKLGMLESNITEPQVNV